MALGALIFSAITLLVAAIGTGFTIANYYRVNDPPNVIVTTSEKRSAVENFYREVGTAFERWLNLPTNMSNSDFNGLNSSTIKLVNDTGAFVAKEFGEQERLRLTDLTGVRTFAVEPRFPPEQGQQRAAVLLVLDMNKRSLAQLLDRLKVR
jgi:hypothetical protein